MSNVDPGHSPDKITATTKLTFKEFCRCSWLALKRVKPIGLPTYVALSIYATFGGWPFPGGRYFSIVGVMFLLGWYVIVKQKLKDAFDEAQRATTLRGKGVIDQ